MEIHVLGSLSVHHDGHDATPTASKPRKVLALLLLNEARVVSTASLLTELWDDAPPRSALTTLQTYILQLRKLIAAALDVPVATVAREVLITRNGGYSFRSPGDDFDLQQYAKLSNQGRAALEAGDDATGVRLIRRALATWTGPVLVDVEHGRLIQTEAARLNQCRLTLIERRIEAELGMRRHRELLGELASLAVEHPFHEDLHGQYMLALHLSGRRERALDVFHQLRGSMIEELGLEPSPRIQRLQHAIISSDPRLDDPHTGISLLQSIPLPEPSRAGAN